MSLTKTFSQSGSTIYGRPASAATSFIPVAPKAVRRLAIAAGFECDNPQIQIRMGGRTYYAHDFGSHDMYAASRPWIKTNAQDGFNLMEVIDGTDPNNPVLVNPEAAELDGILERVASTKRAWTPNGNDTNHSANEIVRFLQEQQNQLLDLGVPG